MFGNNGYVDGVEGDFPLHSAVVEGKITPSARETVLTDFV
jgi:hypothetical protein